MPIHYPARTRSLGDGGQKIGETVSSSRVPHATDTSDVVAGLEQYSGQVDVHDGVYGPWIEVACRKNWTKPLKSGRTSPR